MVTSVLFYVDLTPATNFCVIWLVATDMGLGLYTAFVLGQPDFPVDAYNIRCCFSEKCNWIFWTSEAYTPQRIRGEGKFTVNERRLIHAIRMFLCQSYFHFQFHNDSFSSMAYLVTVVNAACGKAHKVYHDPFKRSKRSWQVWSKNVVCDLNSFSELPISIISWSHIENSIGW